MPIILNASQELQADDKYITEPHHQRAGTLWCYWGRVLPTIARPRFFGLQPRPAKNNFADLAASFQLRNREDAVWAARCRPPIGDIMPCPRGHGLHGRKCIAAVPTGRSFDGKRDVDAQAIMQKLAKDYDELADRAAAGNVLQSSNKASLPERIPNKSRSK